MDAHRPLHIPSSLSPDEQAKALGFRQYDDRQRFVTGRLMMRTILSEKIGVEASEIDITVDRYGRPGSAVLSDLDIDFNLTHSGCHVLLAVSQGGRIGIDLEVGSAGIRESDLASFVLSESEVSALDPNHMQESKDRVLDTFSAKEAVLKLFGLGLAADMRRINLARLPERNRPYRCAVRSPYGSAWCISVDLDGSPRTYLATKHRDPQITMYRASVDAFGALKVMGAGTDAVSGKCA